MAISILFFVRKRRPGQLFQTFRESFSMFSPSRNLLRRRKKNQILAGTGAIESNQKSSKSEPSSRFSGRLKFGRGATLRYTANVGILCETGEKLRETHCNSCCVPVNVCGGRFSRFEMVGMRYHI